MWTKRGFFIVYLQIKKFRLWLPLPIWALKDLLYDFIDMADLFGWKRFSKEVDVEFGRDQLYALVEVLDVITETESYDLVDIEAGEAGETVKVKVKVW